MPFPMRIPFLMFRKSFQRRARGHFPAKENRDMENGTTILKWFRLAEGFNFLYTKKF